MSERQGPVEPTAALRARVMAIADPATPFAGFAERIARLFDLPDAPVRSILTAAAAPASDSWVDGFAPGMRLFHLQGGASVASSDCGLVQLDVEAAVPRHRHGGLEQVLILAGQAEEDRGELWHPGDLVVRDAGSVHGFRSVGNEPLLFAVVLDDGLELV